MAIRTSANRMAARPCTSYGFHQYLDVCQIMASKFEDGAVSVLQQGCDKVRGALMALRYLDSHRECDCPRFFVRARGVLENASPGFRQTYEEEYWPAYGTVLGRIVGVHDPKCKWGAETIWGDLAGKFRDAGPDRWDIRAEIIDCFTTVARSCHGGIADPRSPHYRGFWRAFGLIWGYLEAATENRALPRREIRLAVQRFVELWHTVVTLLTTARGRGGGAANRRAGRRVLPAEVEGRVVSVALPLLGMIADTGLLAAKQSDWMWVMARLTSRPGRRSVSTRRAFQRILQDLDRRARSRSFQADTIIYENLLSRLSQGGLSPS